MLKNIFYKNQNRESGQTLIETMVAVFIMVMGVTAALGLANYSLSASSGIRNQIMGMGLAREGLEAVKNMRDTNWLNATISNDCYNYSTSSPGTPATPSYCYRSWLNVSSPGFNISPPSGQPEFTVDFNSGSSTFWTPVKVSGAADYALYFDANAGVQGFYSSNSSFPRSPFYRQILIDNTTASAPFNQDLGPRLLVTSRVWWTDAKCPRVATWPGKGRCSIELQMYMTNWKTF